MNLVRKRWILILLLLAVAPCLVHGQDISVTAAFDTTRILIGDQIHYNVVVEQPAGITLNLPILKDTLNKNIEIVSGPKIDSSKTGNQRIRITEQYLVTSFDSGFYRVKPVYAETRGANGLKRYYSDYTLLEVSRVRLTPPDSAKIFDIAGPYKAPVTLGEILPWILLFLIVSAIVWLVIRFIRRFSKNSKEPVTPIRIEPAHVIAFRELEKLKNQKLWQSGETKKYYTRLTEILRQYLEDRFSVFSLELTTSETLEELIKTGFKKDESYNRLKSVLNEADLVKFAKYKPEPSENEQSFDNSWDFVDATKITVEEAVSADAMEKEKEVSA
ncbi:MAG: hypothetical protein Q8868_11120 [Bacteroidota bacterium]|nr:hypothetical protein [Bacteroidota bacterium]